MDRRNFIQLAALALADLSIGGPVACTTAVPKAATPNGAASPASTKGRIVFSLAPYGENRSRLRVFDWDDYSFTDIDVPPSYLHAITPDPREPSVLYLFELFGSCVKIDLKTKKILKIDHRGATRVFSGHGALTSSGEFIATSELVEGRRSVLTLRSTKTLAVAAEAPAECARLHQVASVPKTALLAIGNLAGLNGENSGAVTWYDTETKRIAQRIELPMPILHVMPISATEVIAVSREANWRDSKATSVDGPST
ncbi:MAG: DUF1513 domain-containing protein, partial [Bdellovibrionota bacterium]